MHAAKKFLAWRNIPEDAILHSHRRENLKSYISVPVDIMYFHTKRPCHVTVSQNYLFLCSVYL
jgi:hypothetical protein